LTALKHPREYNVKGNTGLEEQNTQWNDNEFKKYGGMT